MKEGRKETNQNNQSTHLYLWHFPNNQLLLFLWLVATKMKVMVLLFLITISLSKYNLSPLFTINKKTVINIVRCLLGLIEHGSSNPCLNKIICQTKHKII